MNNSASAWPGPPPARPLPVPLGYVPLRGGVEFEPLDELGLRLLAGSTPRRRSRTSMHSPPVSCGHRLTSPGTYASREWIATASANGSSEDPRRAAAAAVHPEKHADRRRLPRTVGAEGIRRLHRRRRSGRARRGPRNEPNFLTSARTSITSSIFCASRTACSTHNRAGALQPSCAPAPTIGVHDRLRADHHSRRPAPADGRFGCGPSRSGRSSCSRSSTPALRCSAPATVRRR